jgi:hypothetical protein
MRDTPAIPCPGRHNDRWRHAETGGEQHDLSPVYGEPRWCAGCRTRIATRLADLPDLAARLLLEAEHGTPRPPQDRVSGSRERALHPHDGEYRSIEAIADTLTAWEDDVREHRGYTRRPAARQGTAITTSVRFVAAHLDWLLQQHPEAEATVAFDAEVSQLWRRANRACHLDEPRPEPRDGVPCRRCDLMTLVHELDGAGRPTGYTVCRSCGDLSTEDEMATWMRLAAQPLKTVSAA